MSAKDRLIEERNKTGFNQAKFADLAGIKRGAQANYENGSRSPSLAYLSKLAEAGVDIVYIITGERSGDKQTTSSNDIATYQISDFSISADDFRDAFQTLAKKIAGAGDLDDDFYNDCAKECTAWVREFHSKTDMSTVNILTQYLLIVLSAVYAVTNPHYQTPDPLHWYPAANSAAGLAVNLLDNGAGGNGGRKVELP